MRYLVFLTLISPVFAQGIPDDVKILMLKHAYELNNNSMVGPTIDLSLQDPYKLVVRTETITPVGEYNKIDKAADLKPVVVKEANVCTRHHMRKVVTRNSWHCKR